MVYYGKADASAAQRFVAPAVTGFFRSIELGQVQGESGWWGWCAAEAGGPRCRLNGRGSQLWAGMHV